MLGLYRSGDSRDGHRYPMMLIMETGLQKHYYYNYYNYINNYILEFFHHNLFSPSYHSIVRPTAQSEKRVHLWKSCPEVPAGRGRALPLR